MAPLPLRGGPASSRCSNEGQRLFRGAHTKRKFKYGKELSPHGVECECTQKERSTSITKQLVFPVPVLP
jgi:hypothetical protein